MDERYITKETLDAFGINLKDHDETSLLDHLNETLQERIGTEIAATLPEDKLKALVELQDTASDEQMGSWLTQNVPELPQIVEDEIVILMGEISENKDAINTTAEQS